MESFKDVSKIVLLNLIQTTQVQTKELKQKAAKKIKEFVCYKNEMKMNFKKQKERIKLNENMNVLSEL